MAFAENDLKEALAVLSDVLQERGEAFELLVIGGGALLLLGVIERPTKDLDVVARRDRDRWLSAEPFPETLVDAVRDVAGALDLAENWLNPGPAALMDFGLPVGFDERVETLDYGSLVIHLASRQDHIAFKLYAAADHWPDRSRHFVDLERLTPTKAEILSAAAWCRTHDPSEGFRVRQLEPLLRELGCEVADE